MNPALNSERIEGGLLFSCSYVIASRAKAERPTRDRRECLWRNLPVQYFDIAPYFGG